MAPVCHAVLRLYRGVRLLTPTYMASGHRPLKWLPQRVAQAPNTAVSIAWDQSVDNTLRSLSLLDDLDSPPFRRNVQRAMNRGESYHQ
jgi:hypothetical protein